MSQSKTLANVGLTGAAVVSQSKTLANVGLTGAAVVSQSKTLANVGLTGGVAHITLAVFRSLSPGEQSSGVTS